MSRQKPPRIVAELGRPESPQEAAERKRDSSRRHREGQTLLNLVIALVASLAVVLVLVLVAVRPEMDTRSEVDYLAVAKQAQGEVDVSLAAPALPEGWYANAARLESGASDGVVTWYVGFITPQEQYIALRQGIGANPTWVSNQVGGTGATGTVSIGGVTWQLYERRRADAGNLEYAMSASTPASEYVLHGTANDEEFSVLSKAIADAIEDGS